MAIYINEAVTETMFSTRPKYRRQAPLVTGVNLLKVRLQGSTAHEEKIKLTGNVE